MAAIMLISTCNYGIVYCTSIIYIYTFRLFLTFNELFNFYTVGNLT